MSHPLSFVSFVSSLVCCASNDLADLLDIGAAPTAPRKPTPPHGVRQAIPTVDAPLYDKALEQGRLMYRTEQGARDYAAAMTVQPPSPVTAQQATPPQLPEPGERVHMADWAQIRTGAHRGEWGATLRDIDLGANDVKPGDRLRIFRRNGDESVAHYLLSTVMTTQRGLLVRVTKDRAACEPSNGSVATFNTGGNASGRHAVTAAQTWQAVDRVSALAKSSPTGAAQVAAQDQQRVDAEGAKRAAADEALAKSLGFNPKPPVYEIGTVVNSIGVENFRQSREDWAKLPTLPELARTFSAQIAAEKRADLLVPATSCRALAMGGLSTTHNGTPATFSMAERAMHGLAAHVTPGGASYLAACPPALRADNLNHWLSVAKRVDAKATKATGHAVEVSRDMTLRTRETLRGDREVFAVTGPKYAAFDVDRVMEKAAEGIGGDARGNLKYDGYRMTLDAMFHSNVQPKNAVAGEFFKGTIRVKAADDGSGSINVSLGLWRNLCRNLIIVNFDKVLVGSRRHVGSVTMADDIAGLMATASERIDLIVGKWSEASTENVLERYDLGDADAVIKGLVLNGAVKATGVKSDDMIERLTRAWRMEPGYGKTAFLNAITRAAHEESWQSWADSEDLESQAGALLYQPVWNLDISDRSAEELLA